MMMPANFTAVNSEVVYGGADLFSILADTTAPVWNAANVKTFNTNLLTILSNSFTKPLVNATMGTMFGGNWGGDNGVKLFGDEGTVSTFFKNQAGVDASGLCCCSVHPGHHPRQELHQRDHRWHQRLIVDP